MSNAKVTAVVVYRSPILVYICPYCNKLHEHVVAENDGRLFQLAAVQTVATCNKEYVMLQRSGDNTKIRAMLEAQHPANAAFRHSEVDGEHIQWTD